MSPHFKFFLAVVLAVLAFVVTPALACEPTNNPQDLSCPRPRYTEI